jgi:hypothetical protein
MDGRCAAMHATYVSLIRETHARRVSLEEAHYLASQPFVRGVSMIAIMPVHRDFKRLHIHRQRLMYERKVLTECFRKKLRGCPHQI